MARGVREAFARRSRGVREAFGKVLRRRSRRRSEAFGGVRGRSGAFERLGARKRSKIDFELRTGYKCTIIYILRAFKGCYDEIFPATQSTNSKSMTCVLVQSCVCGMLYLYLASIFGKIYECTQFVALHCLYGGTTCAIKCGECIPRIRQPGQLCRGSG